MPNLRHNPNRREIDVPTLPKSVQNIFHKNIDPYINTMALVGKDTPPEIPMYPAQFTKVAEALKKQELDINHMTYRGCRLRTYSGG